MTNNTAWYIKVYSWVIINDGKRIFADMVKKQGKTLTRKK